VTGRAATLGLAFVLLSGCDGVQSMLEPRGPHAARIANLWWIMLAVCTVVLLIVCGLVLAAVLRGRISGETALSLRQQRSLVIAGGVAAPVIVLLAFLVYSVNISQAMITEPANPLRIAIVGHQWWWQVSYPGEGRTDLNVSTANEIHIPVGRPVSIELQSRDVIHSFWVPNLHGKTDVIPGRKTRTWIQADAPGTWRGQCAEYCGLQHAHMAFMVIAEPPEVFYAWMNAQREPAPEPQSPSAIRGREVFLNGPCMMCHTVRGTPAESNYGPDLTHVASRRTLAAATITNTRGHRAGWVLDPQVIKPGTQMPPTNLSNEDLHAVLDYLETLR
jgi:cytochrome c oxidase subunit 2